MRRLPNSLGELGIAVSTGRVVDFRARQWLQSRPTPGAFPLIYPLNFSGQTVVWPREQGKKAQALEATCPDDVLIPVGYYTLVKRFSSKEEKRRIVACVLDPQSVSGSRVGLENHLNYFHKNGAGLDRELAIGLARFLNTEQVDTYFRQWSGHTQVNATDLRSLRYPSIEILRQAGTCALEKIEFADDRFFE
jgi:adenine-specific DNA-methyltransferase